MKVDWTSRCPATAMGEVEVRVRTKEGVSKKKRRKRRKKNTRR